jgi:hypothetical protein
MLPLIKHITLLPADLVGCHVLSFLPLKSLVRLDMSVGNSLQLCAWKEAIACSTVRVSSDEGRAQASWHRKLWQWCAVRRVTVTELVFSDVEAEEVAALKGAMHCVPPNGLVGWNCFMGTGHSNEVPCVLHDMEIISRITCLRLYNYTGGDYPLNTWNQLRRVTELLMSGPRHSEEALLQILLGRVALQTLSLDRFTFQNATTMHAISSHAKTLTTLLISDMSCHPLFLTVVGQSCANLRRLEIQHYYKPDVRAWVTEAGLLAIAEGCRRLERLELRDIPLITEDVLLAFAAQCSELLELSCSRHAPLTDAVLLGFATGCLKLRGLTCTPWVIKSVDTVEASMAMFSCLTTCPIDCSHPTSPTVVANVVEALENAVVLSLTNVTAVHLAALCDQPFVRFQSIALDCAPGSGVAADDILTIAATASSQNLLSLHLHGGCTVRAATLLIVAALCPNITKLGVASVLGELPDSTIVTLLRHWPRLQYIDICSNVSFTDAVLRAIALHCPLLNWLHLNANTTVSESAVLQLAERGGFEVLSAPVTFSPEAKRIVNEHYIARRIKRPQ